MTLETDYGQVCLDAFVNCENILTKLDQKRTAFSSELLNLLSECAHICMGTFHAIKNSSVNMPKLALLCIGICDECAEACDTIDCNLFKQCAQACRFCSDNMSDLAIACE